MTDLYESAVKGCIETICWECRKGDTPVRCPDGDWAHIMLGFDDRTEYCAAAKLHELIWEKTNGANTR